MGGRRHTPPAAGIHSSEFPRRHSCLTMFRRHTGGCRPTLTHCTVRRSWSRRATTSFGFERSPNGRRRPEDTEDWMAARSAPVRATYTTRGKAEPAAAERLDTAPRPSCTHPAPTDYSPRSGVRRGLLPSNPGGRAREGEGPSGRGLATLRPQRHGACARRADASLRRRLRRHGQALGGVGRRPGGGAHQGVGPRHAERIPAVAGQAPVAFGDLRRWRGRRHPLVPSIWPCAGSATSVWHFNRTADALQAVQRILLWIVAGHFVDDFNGVDMDDVADSAFQAWPTSWSCWVCRPSRRRHSRRHPPR